MPPFAPAETSSVNILDIQEFDTWRIPSVAGAPDLSCVGWTRCQDTRE